MRVFSIHYVSMLFKFKKVQDKDTIYYRDVTNYFD